MTQRSPTLPAEDPSSARERLLERAVRHLLAHGLSNGSLRAIATELDTSHRMLIYHFGSAEEFWDAALQQLRRRDQQALAEATAAGRMPELEEVWAQLSSPRNLSIMRVLFQLYGEALKDRARFTTFLSQFVEGWLQAIGAAMQKQHGFSRAQSMLEARLSLAVVRGLLLDLITTGDRKGTTAALHEYARRDRLWRVRS
jgi:AcrR family transcriptional regulator